MHNAKHFAGVCWKNRYNCRVIAAQCALAGIFLARVETYKVSYPPHAAAFCVVVTGSDGERARQSQGSPGVVRSRPGAQQKRDKSSTLIRILPLFALWNTILNGMGAQ